MFQASVACIKLKKYYIPRLAIFQVFEPENVMEEKSVSSKIWSMYANNLLFYF